MGRLNIKALVKQFFRNQYRIGPRGHFVPTWSATLMYAFLLFPIVIFILAGDDISDSFVDFADDKALVETEGLFRLIKNRRGGNYWLLMTEEGGEIKLRAGEKPSEILLGDVSLSHQGQHLGGSGLPRVRWFQLPSGFGYLVEVETNNKKIIDYELSHKEFIEQRILFAQLISWCVHSLCFSSVFFLWQVLRLVWQVKRGELNG